MQDIKIGIRVSTTYFNGVLQVGTIIAIARARKNFIIHTDNRIGHTHNIYSNFEEKISPFPSEAELKSRAFLLYPGEVKPYEESDVFWWEVKKNALLNGKREKQAYLGVRGIIKH